MRKKDVLTLLRFSPGERVGPGDAYRFPYLRLMKAYLIARPYTQRKRVLDIACGEGHGLSILSRGARLVVGSDLSTSTLKRYRQRSPEGHPCCVAACAEELPFRDGSFPVITSFQAIEHIGRERRFLEEVRRVLAPTGIFLCSTPNRATLLAGINPYHVREYSQRSFSAVLRGCFRRVQILGIHCVGPAAELKSMEHRIGRGFLSCILPGFWRSLPLSLRVVLYNAAFSLIHRFMRMTRYQSYTGLGIHDFSVQSRGIEDAADLLAVCRK